MISRSNGLCEQERILDSFSQITKDLIIHDRLEGIEMCKEALVVTDALSQQAYNLAFERIFREDVRVRCSLWAVRFSERTVGIANLHASIFSVFDVAQPQLGTIDGRGLPNAFQLENGSLDEKDSVLEVRSST